MKKPQPRLLSDPELRPLSDPETRLLSDPSEASVADIVVVANITVDIADPSEAANILAEANHDLSCCLSLHAYHILLWV